MLFPSISTTTDPSSMSIIFHSATFRLNYVFSILSFLSTIYKFTKSLIIIFQNPALTI